MVLALAIITAAAALSVWVFVRFPTRAPDTLEPALIHVGLSIALFYGFRPLVTPVVDALMFPVNKYLLVFALLLPLLTYRFVTTLWMLNLVQRAARGRM